MMISTLVVARVTTTFLPLYKWAVLPFLFKGDGVFSYNVVMTACFISFFIFLKLQLTFGIILY